MKDRGWAWFTMMIVAIILLAQTLYFTPAKASPFTTVNLALESDPPEVDVSPGSSGMVTITGTVTCVKWGPDTVKVSLIAEADCGEASVVPANFVFSQSSGTEESETFSVSTRVPNGYPCTATPAITVSGYWDQGGLRTQIAPVSQIIIILQYYKMEISVIDPIISAAPGDNVDFNFNLYNRGNGEDTFHVDIENRAPLNKKGFKLSAPAEVPACPDDGRNVHFEIGIPENITGNFTLYFSVRSEGAESCGMVCKENMAITLQVAKNTTASSKSKNALETLPAELYLLLIVISVVITAVEIAVYLRKRRNRETYSLSPP